MLGTSARLIKMKVMVTSVQRPLLGVSAATSRDKRFHFGVGQSYMEDLPVAVEWPCFTTHMERSAKEWLTQQNRRELMRPLRQSPRVNDLCAVHVHFSTLA